MLNRVMPRDNIALVAVFKIKDAVYSTGKGKFAYFQVDFKKVHLSKALPFFLLDSFIGIHFLASGHRMPMNPNESVVSTPMVVCTAHIHWDPEFCDVKLIQSMMLAHELNKIVEDVAEKHHIQPQQTPVLICGDLNSLPDSGRLFHE